jgi:hypothetical protein
LTISARSFSELLGAFTGFARCRGARMLSTL